MMNRKAKIEEEVQKTLACFDQAEPLKANPFFYTRLKARIDELDGQKARAKNREFVAGILQPTLLTFVVAVNVFTAVIFFTQKSEENSNRAQLLNAFASEMTLDTNEYNPNFLNLK